MANKVPRHKRLTAAWYRSADCTAAIRGELIPHAFGDIVTRSCIVRGIRYHPQYAKDFAKEFPEAGPIFKRALNARSIMSNTIPEITDAEHFPYCIWHPEVASVETYRELARRYPEMKYLVGRACAVAGYTELYAELNLLPEVNIADEARDNGSMDIFDAIMSQPTKYWIMNDYNRTISPSSPMPSVLNGDTAVRSYLEIKRMHKKPTKDCDGTLYFHSSWQRVAWTRDHHFNITEDFSVDDYESPPPSTEQVVKLLYSPLPADLPAIPDKDLLVLMAAHRGDIDRYSRLRRPYMLSKEKYCIVRGIYHNPFFAKWWSLNPPECLDRRGDIAKAITARFIMSNDLSRVDTSICPGDPPYTIWYPAVPGPTTLEELVRRRPDMKHQAARACIVADYQYTYDKIDADPDEALIYEARGSVNPYYLADLQRKIAQGRESKEIGGGYSEWKKYSRKDIFEPSSTWLNNNVGAANIGNDFGWIYDEWRADASCIELHVCMADTLREEHAQELNVKGFLDLDEIYNADE